MSILSVCVDQILRPSWLPVYEDARGRRSSAVMAEKRRQVMLCLEAAGKPVPSRWVMDYTEYTKQSVMHLLYGLEEAGLVSRSRGAGGILFWALVPGGAR